MVQTDFHLSAERSSQEDEEAALRNLLFCTIFVIVAALYASYEYWTNIFEKFSWVTSFISTSSVLLLVMAIMYFHAGTFYKKQFFRYIGLAWLFNLLYLVSGFGSPDPSDAGAYLPFRSKQMLLAIISAVPFYLAVFGDDENEQISKKRFLAPLIAVGSWFLIRICFYPAVGARVHVVLAVFFGFYVLLRVYKTVDSRIDAKRLLGGPLLKFSFLAYAWLQLSFLFVLFDRTRHYVPWIMTAGLIAKATNAYALALVLRDDYAEIRAKNETARLELEKALEKTEEAIKKDHEFEEVGKLTAAIEHELRTPIGVIASVTREMGKRARSDQEGNKELIKELEILDQQRVRILEATRIIRTLRSPDQTIVDKLEMLSVNDVVKRSVDELKRSLNLEGNVHFRTTESTHNLHIKGDRPLLQQAVVNILKNAVESIQLSRDSGKIEIQIGLARETKDIVEMRFQDNGSGIPEEFIPKLTTAGFSINKRDKPNSGLGLYVSERIVKIHNGRLELKNSEHGGACVSILLPRFFTKKQRTVRESGDEADNTEQPLSDLP